MFDSEPVATIPSASTDARPAHDLAARFGSAKHDPRDPDPWLALYLDQSVPIDEQAKAALVLDLQSFSRQFLHPVIRPIARLLVMAVGLFRLLVPRGFTSPGVLHRLIHWGLRNFVSPQANFLILRHFHIGSEVLAFIAANAPVVVETEPIRPRVLKDVEDEIFLRHDLNLYNFIIRLNQGLKNHQTRLHPPARLNFDPISQGGFAIEPFPKRWTNFLDLASAIEIYTPLYQLFLSDKDFWRASNSLQLDETVGIYVASILGDATHLSLLNNRHPLVPLSIFRAGYRLILHGLSSECLHALLVHHSGRQTESERSGTADDGAHGLGALWGRTEAHAKV